MPKETPPLFGKTRFLEGRIEEFLNKVAEEAIYFERDITTYLEQMKVSENCEEKLLQILS